MNWRSAADEELAYPGALKHGDSGQGVRRLQEWLTLSGYNPGPVDGEFGQRTVDAVYGCVRQHGDMADFGRWLSQQAWQHCTAPMRRAFDASAKPMGMGHALPPPEGQTRLGAGIVAVAQAHLSESPRELPGNKGPWVRAYNGWLAKRDRLPCVCGHSAVQHYSQRAECKEACDCDQYRPNAELAWCAGFVSTVLHQAAASLGVDPPLPGSLSCDVLAAQARKAGLFFEGGGVSFIHPGDVFLLCGKQPDDYVHTGIVVEVLAEGIRTIEGNTNKAGSREGTAVMERALRQWTGLDFVFWRRP